MTNPAHTALVETVARAICKNAGHVSDRHWKSYVTAATAAIAAVLEALQEPSDDMLDAGAHFARYAFAADVWQAMLSASALSASPLKE